MFIVKADYLSEKIRRVTPMAKRRIRSRGASRCNAATAEKVRQSVEWIGEIRAKLAG